ncbi:hypothetical protein CEH05_05465 [Halobacillus halophilus]|uniref:Uncharacterized protein n=1 Tax=Halobacillus halophilus (strain ATCC 35676 / DSM 2266 / JCM 20832 / KCTC 3685 / LMG 17431 / NBRC 102448 / NCIMB 2269) TaxID=866895 RepID=I0JJW3_HALH3|nr:hypothetical protein [Halobacillus halophilus]ASF38583.1 hypothetical protein CEH05_05465 [Halobacillus halophilus]CCG44432.1 hypothetical protein HBHAL_2074 [Halobacillus halophilus DSM 2266]
MANESKVIHHITDYNEFKNTCLDNDGMAFPELEKIMYDYILSQPSETMKFQECVIKEEPGENEELRKVYLTFRDYNMNNYIRLWGFKSNADGRVVDMKVDALDPETNEVVYERQLS